MTAREVFERHRDLAGRIAHAYLRRLPQSIEAAEVRTVALGGLWDAAVRHHALPPNEFEGIAVVRVRGAITDHLRAFDDFPRRARQGYGKLWRMLYIEAFENTDVLRQFSVVHHIEADIDEHARGAWLLEKVLRLPPQQKLIIGRILGGETQKEIGDSLGLTQARISQIVSEAKATLQAAWIRWRDR